MGFVVDVHQLADGGMGVFLRGGERLVAEKFLDGTKVGTIGQKMRGERVAERVRMQIPIHIDQANVFFDDATHGTLREAAAGVIQKNRFGVRRGAAAGARARRLQQKFLAQRPVFIESFLSFAAVRYDALFVALAADPQHAFVLVDVDQVETSKFADAEAGSVEKLEQGAIARQEQPFFN